MIEANQSEADLYKFLAEGLGGMASEYKVSSSLQLKIRTKNVIKTKLNPLT